MPITITNLKVYSKLNIKFPVNYQFQLWLNLKSY